MPFGYVTYLFYLFDGRMGVVAHGHRQVARRRQHTLRELLVLAPAERRGGGDDANGGARAARGVPDRRGQAADALVALLVVDGIAEAEDSFDLRFEEPDVLCVRVAGSFMATRFLPAADGARGCRRS